MGLSKAIEQRMNCSLHTNNRHTIMTKYQAHPQMQRIFNTI